MDGRNEIALRLKEWTFGQTFRRLRNNEPNIQLKVLAREATQVIAGAVTKYDDDDLAKDFPSFDIEGFGRFGETREGVIELQLEPDVLEKIRAHELASSSILGMSSWDVLIPGDINNLQPLWPILEDALFATFKQKRGLLHEEEVFILTIENRSRAVEVVSTVFFEAVVAALTLGKSVDIWGLMRFDFEAGKLVFEPDESLKNSAEHFHARKQPRPHQEHRAAEFVCGERDEEPGPILRFVGSLFGLVLSSVLIACAIPLYLKRKFIRFWLTNIWPPRVK